MQAWMRERDASFTVEFEHVLGTVHDSEGHLSGYDVQGPLAIATVDECNGWLAGQLYAAVRHGTKPLQRYASFQV